MVICLYVLYNNPKLLNSLRLLEHFSVQIEFFMQIYEKIKHLREFNHWTQEEVAERMGMSPSGYAKIERGETKLHLDKIQQLAQIFEVNLFDLLIADNGGDTFYNNIHNNGNSVYNKYYAHNENMANEIESLKQIIACKDEIIAEKEKQIVLLTKLLDGQENH